MMLQLHGDKFSALCDALVGAFSVAEMQSILRASQFKDIANGTPDGLDLTHYVISMLDLANRRGEIHMVLCVFINEITRRKMIFANQEKALCAAFDAVK